MTKFSASENKKALFIYPRPKTNLGGNNPYIKNLARHLSEYFYIMNQKDEKGIDLLAMYKYFFRCHYYYLNWFENIPNYRYGQIKFILAVIFLFLTRIFPRKKIIWTHHNIQVHLNENQRTRFLKNFFLRNADLIIGHTSYSKELLAQYRKNNPVFNFFHPMQKCSSEPFTFHDKQYDILIWGKMSPYKGVLELLDYLQTRGKLNHYKVLIAGKFMQNYYYEKVRTYQSDNVIIENRYIEEQELVTLHKKARYVIFPYLLDSVLNSGAMAYTLEMKHPGIIGPNQGAFSDLAQKGLILTYNHYRDLTDHIDNRRAPSNVSLIDRFCREHTWKHFAEKVSHKIHTL